MAPKRDSVTWWPFLLPSTERNSGLSAHTVEREDLRPFPSLKVWLNRERQQKNGCFTDSICACPQCVNESDVEQRECKRHCFGALNKRISAPWSVRSVFSPRMNILILKKKKKKKLFTSDITWSVTADELSLLMKATLCVCWQRRGSNVIWVPKQNSSHVLVPSEGEKVNKASIHRRCHCSQKGETVHTGFHAIYHTVISHSLWSLWSFLLLSCLHPSDSWPSLSLSLSPGTSIEHYDRLSLIWCSPLRWPNTLNTSTNLSTASTSRWLLSRRTGWDWKERNHPASLLSLLHTCVENSRSNFSAFFFFFF